MIFGYARSCYSLPCRFYVNGTVQRIQWYFAPEGAKVYTEPTIFNPGSQELQYRHTSGVGELWTEKSRYSKGATIDGVDGQMAHGTRNDFLGLSMDPGPISLAEAISCREPPKILFAAMGEYTPEDSLGSLHLFATSQGASHGSLHLSATATLGEPEFSDASLHLNASSDFPDVDFQDGSLHLNASSEFPDLAFDDASLHLNAEG